MHEQYDDLDTAKREAHSRASMRRLYVVLRTQDGRYEITTKSDAVFRRVTKHIVYITHGTGTV